MIILSKIIQQFLLIEMWFFAATIILAIFIYIKVKDRRLVIITAGLAVVFYASSITPTADLFIRPLENDFPSFDYSQITTPKIDIIFLTGNHESNILRAAEALKLIAYADTNDLDYQLIISGVNIFDRSISAEPIDLYFESLGVPRDKIAFDQRSQTTADSGQSVFNATSDNTTAILVTSAYHMPRSMFVFKTQAPLPAPADYKYTGEYSILDFFPQASNWTTINLATHEYSGLLYYQLIND
ncbi:TPA: hypothetical protein DF272_03400 [Candidatus Falkowbacteria bacterium]|nr:hypothetical protein [Candidatus Falkowbacteria bacterium]